MSTTGCIHGRERSGPLPQRLKPPLAPRAIPGTAETLPFQNGDRAAGFRGDVS